MLRQVKGMGFVTKLIERDGRILDEQADGKLSQAEATLAVYEENVKSLPCVDVDNALEQMQRFELGFALAK